MKRSYFILIIFVFFAISNISAQIIYSFESENYHINSDVSEPYAKEIAEKMEAALVLFNNFLHFNTDALEAKLNVTIFKNKDKFDLYLISVLKASREDFVYIHYSDISKSELVGFKKDSNEDFNSSLLHQGFIQFLKSYVPNPPIWLREGTATCLESSQWDSTIKSFSYKPNFIWLKTLKSIIQDTGYNATILSMDSLLSLDKDNASRNINVFYPQSWGFVFFLLNSENKEYNRMFWDTITNLESDATLMQNSLSVKQNIFKWINLSIIQNDFITYIESLKTYQELVQDGVNYYTLEQYTEAEESFKKAIIFEPEAYISFYYLGLISYAKKEYLIADSYYKQAILYGAETGITKYAMGINAFANSQYKEAIGYLLEAKFSDPENYTANVDSLLLRINTLQ